MPNPLRGGQVGYVLLPTHRSQRGRDRMNSHSARTVLCGMSSCEQDLTLDMCPMPSTPMHTHTHIAANKTGQLLLIGKHGAQLRAPGPARAKAAAPAPTHSHPPCSESRHQGNTHTAPHGKARRPGARCLRVQTLGLK